MGKWCFLFLLIPKMDLSLCDNNKGITFTVCLLLGHTFFILGGGTNMKYCSKCGTQMSDDTMVCPQCHPTTNNQQSQISNLITPPKHTSNKIIPLIITNLIISSLTLIATIGMYFISPLSSNSVNNNNTPCPANEYGNHDWSIPNCVEPAHCYDCGAYKDDKLGEHNFWVTSDDIKKCMHCGILYEVYMDSLN